jgi:hypothetical protein
MRLPTIRGLIDRRILVNYRVDPNILARQLPAPLRPKLVHGLGMAGICLIRLRHVRPQFVPGWLGISSENAAHRIAVEWDDEGGIREGVYVRRRDTNSRLNTLAGGRIFPGTHHHARFVVEETAGRYFAGVRSDDGDTKMMIRGRVADALPGSSIFADLAEASSFFERGSLGYSATSDPSRLDGLELRCLSWSMQPLAVDEVHSTYFDDVDLFPRGSIDFDCALLMRNIEHQWIGRPDLCCNAEVVFDPRRSSTKDLTLASRE